MNKQIVTKNRPNDTSEFPQQNFRSAILDAGFEHVPPIQPGKMHRFPGIGKKRSNKAAYAKLFDDCRGGVFGDWASGFTEAWQAGNQDDLTPQDKARFKREIEQAKRQREKEQRQQHQQAAIQAREKWDTAKPETGTHKYLINKQIQAHGARTNGYQLLIPIRNIDGVLQSLQTIDPNGRKMFLAGGKVYGGMFAIGELKPDATICICEGFATGATIHEETRHPVVVAFNANNLKAVTRAISKKYPDADLIICADNDRQTQGNPGVIKATEAAQAVNAGLAIPKFPDNAPPELSDFNDLMLWEKSRGASA